MEELLKEIGKSIVAMQKGVQKTIWTSEGYKTIQCQADRGIGTKAYTIRRIEILQDKLKELKSDIKSGKYDYDYKKK